MRFFLFILANAMLFIRPSELIAELAAVEIYRYLIIACLGVSLPVVLQQLSERYTSVPPIISCVILLFPATFLSGFFHGNFELIQETVTEFAKVVIYFLLLVSLITDLASLRQFLRWIGLFSAAVTLIAVMRYHADVAIPPPQPKYDPANKPLIHGTFVVDEVRDPETGNLMKVNRMCGTGIFNDPNDFALILVTAVPLCLYWLTDPANKAMRPLWLILLLFFGYALMLTHSRGGFLALMAGLATLFNLRFGSKKTILLGLPALPLLLVVFAGRMTDISTGGGTGQARIQLWSDGLTCFQLSPLFGIGMDNYRTLCKQVAHNSFIHSYTELGFIGGTLFLGAFWFAVLGLYKVRQRPSVPTPGRLEGRPEDGGNDVDPDLQRLHPYLMAMLVAYTIGICFLSRSYIVPTYMMLGLAVVYMRLHARHAFGVTPAPSGFVWPKLMGISCGFLASAFVFVRLFVQWH